MQTPTETNQSKFYRLVAAAYGNCDLLRALDSAENNAADTASEDREIKPYSEEYYALAIGSILDAAMDRGIAQTAIEFCAANGVKI